MDFQKMMIIFILIFVPISVVLSAYIRNQVDTIQLQADYKDKLINSTYEAINAYEMNTMSPDVAVGEGNKRYVLASVNTFFNSLATNLGVSGSNINDLKYYVPAILFTNYDGYYIYSPTKMPKVATDSKGIALSSDSTGKLQYLKKDVMGNNSNDFTDSVDSSIGTKKESSIEVNDESKLADENGDIGYEYQYIVKPYVYYSATYHKDNKYDIIVNYSLDNYISLYGRIYNGNWIEFTKSGYFIDYRKVLFDGNLYMECFDGRGYNQDQNVANGNITKDMSFSSNSNTVFQPFELSDTNKLNDIYRYITDYSKSDYNNSRSDNSRLQTGDEIIEDSLKYKPQDIGIIIETSDGQKIKIDKNDESPEAIAAKEYYLKAYFFSKWVDENLGTHVEINSIITDVDQNASGIDDKIAINFESDDKLFEISDDNNPESSESYFYNHRRAVIQNSILYSLNSAISSYSQHYGDFQNQLPVLREDDWDKILDNISMTTFLQGLPCGTKRFNDYATITSTNNNQFIDKDNLYYTKTLGEPSTQLDNVGDYHRYDCPELGKSGTENYIADLSAEFKFDARKIQVRCTSNVNGYYHDTNTGKIVDPTTNTSYDLNNFTNDIFYFDESANKYYDINWQEVQNVDNDFILNLRESANGDYYQIDESSTSDTAWAVYKYNHKNTACYECMVSSNYTPIMEFDNNGEMVLSKNVIDENDSNKLSDYGETVFGTDANAMNKAINELNKRRRTWYIYLAKYKNNIYKTNSYVNR